SLLNAPRTPHPYTLSLHDALPIWANHRVVGAGEKARRDERHIEHRPGADEGVVIIALHHHQNSAKDQAQRPRAAAAERLDQSGEDRKSTRLNSSHLGISYAVFCLK